MRHYHKQRYTKAVVIYARSLSVLIAIFQVNLG